MQKRGKCELCGQVTLVADYGFNREFVCVDCTLDDPELSDHVDAEMIRRWGLKTVQRITNEAWGKGSMH